MNRGADLSVCSSVQQKSLSAIPLTLQRDIYNNLSVYICSGVFAEHADKLRFIYNSDTEGLRLCKF